MAYKEKNKSKCGNKRPTKQKIKLLQNYLFCEHYKRTIKTINRGWVQASKLQRSILFLSHKGKNYT